MKKILITLFFMFLSVFSFGLGDASADVEVYAEVVGPLEIKTTPVNFGVIAKNSNRNLPETEGTINIKGTEGANIKVTFTSSNREWDATKGAVLVALSPTGEIDFTDLTKTLYYYADIYYNDIRLKSNSIIIPENGEINFKVSGTLDAGNVIPGKYEGKFTVKVQYD
ncbi:MULTISPECIES: hypothetical protein [Fusobacterium]|uniref:hypothetical protein n=1 Tax=Fusobacterium TaxID=848 RepID=UPI001476972C|nr:MULTISPECIES: hypothetical protein [Fusobacterium]NME36202.1 hypothetical protein [Fusobacterium sp. FSA-380-WT-3A]